MTTNRIFDLLLLLGWLCLNDIYIYGCVVRRVRRSSFRLSRLVYRLLQKFQERLFKDKEETLIILTAFLSSSTFIFFL